MNHIEPIEFSQLLASRICHDLISPVAAVNNGIELLMEDDDQDDPIMRKQALELVEDSARIAALKLTLMRAAFGAGHSLPEDTSCADLLNLCQPIADKNKVQILWDQTPERHLNRNQGRIMLNLILILLESLPRGGMIEFIQQETHFECQIQSQKLIFSDEKCAYLCRSQDIPLEPRYIGFIILSMLAPNMQFNIEKQDQHMKIEFTL